MKRLYQARDNIEANLLKDRLAQQHIQAIVRGEYLGGAAGDLPAFVFPEVWVHDDDLLPARRILGDFLRPAEDRGDWRCPNCGEVVGGEFDLCWNCTTERP